MTDVLNPQDMKFINAAVTDDGKISVLIDVGDNKLLFGKFELRDLVRLPYREAVNSLDRFLPGMPVPLCVTLRASCDCALIETRDDWVTLGEAANQVLDGLRSHNGALTHDRDA